MIYTIAGILSLLSALGAWIFKLINDNRQLKEKAAQNQAAKDTVEWADKVQKIEDKVTVDERDYENAKKKFEDNYSGTKPLPPGGQQ